VDDLGTNCRLEQRITAECFFNEFFKFLNLRLMFKLMVILNQLANLLSAYRLQILPEQG